MGRPGVNAQDGGSVRLTLDQDLQYTVQRDLDAAVRQSQARGGQVTIVNVHTGEVLALASTGSFNPEDPSTIKNGQSLDPNVQQVFEPGSANKIVTMSAAIEYGVARPDDVLNVPGSIRVADRTINDAWRHGLVHFTLTGVLAKSSNVGTLMLAQRVGPERFYDMVRKFGLGQRTNVGLPGAAGVSAWCLQANTVPWSADHSRSRSARRFGAPDCLPR